METATPAAPGDAIVMREHLDGEPDDERECIVGDALVIGAERHGHRDAVAGRRLDINLVIADAEAGDDPELRRAREHPLGIELAAGNRGDHARQPRDQLVLGEEPVLVVHHDLEPRLAQRRQERSRASVDLLDVAEDLAQARFDH
jgi:hypothetical protein